jgi:hypothetical protein
MEGYRRHGTNRPGTTLVPWRTCVLAAGMLVSAVTGGAQSMRGVVLDAATRMPIAGTVVQLQAAGDSRPRRVTADSTGSFALSMPAPGLYTLTATRLGYIQHRGDTVRIGDSETVGVEIRLDRTAIPLRPVVVTERVSALPDGFEKRRAAGFGRFITKSDIDNRRAANTSDLLRGIPGVVLTAARRGRGSGSVLFMRGPAGLCQPAVWIDGLQVSTADLAIDQLLSPAVLEAAEVYNSTSTAPSQYRTGNCGVVLFWTKRGQTEDRVRTKWWKLALGASVGVGLVFLFK